MFPRFLDESMRRLTMSRSVAHLVAVVLLLAACDSPADPQTVERIETLPRALTGGEVGLIDAGEAHLAPCQGPWKRLDPLHGLRVGKRVTSCQQENDGQQVRYGTTHGQTTHRLIQETGKSRVLLPVPSAASRVRGAGGMSR